MKIILIEPKGSSQLLHSGLGYLASNIGKNHQVIVYDFNFLDWSLEEIEDKIKQEAPDLVGISIKSANVKKVLKIAQRIKSIFKGILICGGPHITLCGLEFFKNEASGIFNFGFCGEGENSFSHFCQAIESGSSYEDIAGLIYLKDDKWRINPNQLENNLDVLNFPDFSVVIGVNVSELPYPLLTSRGCPYSCIYCSVGKVSGRVWRYRTPGNIIDELKSAFKKYNFKRFEIVDDNFTLDKERVKNFCRLLLQENLNVIWSCPNGIRADRLDEEMIFLMRRSGCQEVSIGIESGDEQVFDKIKKGEFLADIKNSVDLLKKGGIKTSGFFIVGLPGDSLASTYQTLDFIEDLNLDGTKWNLLIPYPQTELWDWVKLNGRFLSDFTEGQHFTREGFSLLPVFETTDFPAKARIRAYKIANLACGNYRYVFKIPQNRLIYKLKISLYLLYYSPRTFFKKIMKKIKI